MISVTTSPVMGVCASGSGTVTGPMSISSHMPHLESQAFTKRV